MGLILLLLHENKAVTRSALFTTAVCNNRLK